MKLNKKNIATSCGVCAAAAGYAVASLAMEHVKQNYGILTRTGCSLIQAYIGIDVGQKVRQKTLELLDTVSEKASVDNFFS